MHLVFHPPVSLNTAVSDDLAVIGPLYMAHPDGCIELHSSLPCEGGSSPCVQPLCTVTACALVI